MAKKQTRGSVSLSLVALEAAESAAQSKGVSVSAFVTAALRASGCEIPETQHFPPDHADRALAGRLSTPDARRDRERARNRRKYQARVLARSFTRADGPIRRALGSEIADMCGEPMREVGS